jgi:hypothetical protein
MSKIITDTSELVKQPYDKFWDEPPTRREMQKALKKMGANDAELMGMCDTAALVLNFILEVKLDIKDRTELDIYVEAKKLQLAEMREKMLKAAQEQDNQADGTK